MGCPWCGFVGVPHGDVYDTTFPCPRCRRGGVTGQAEGRLATVARTMSNPPVHYATGSASNETQIGGTVHTACGTICLARHASSTAEDTDCERCLKALRTRSTRPNPRRNAVSRQRPACGACAQTWHWSKESKTGYYTPCGKHQLVIDEAAMRRAAAKGAREARLATRQRVKEAELELRHRALARGIDAPDDVPDEARENPRKRRNSDADLRALERRVTSGDLGAVQALARAYERAGRGAVRAPGAPRPCLDLQDGWGLLDIGDVQEAIHARTNNDDRLDIDVVWRECGQGNTNVAIRQLEDAGWDFSGNRAVDDVFVMSVPDDFYGESYRVYVRYVNRTPPETSQGRARPGEDEDEDEDEGQSYVEEHADEHRRGVWVDSRICQGIGCPYGDTGPS